MSVPPKAFDTLLVLVQNSGSVLRKDDLIGKVWPDSYVEESNLNHYISVLRKTLNDGATADGYVETVRGFGFRLNAEVTVTHLEVSSSLMHRRTRTHVVIKEEERESKMTTLAPVGSGSSRRVFILPALAVCVMVAGSLAAYFGYIRSGQSRNAKAASVEVPLIRTKTAENPAAREAYLRGRYFWK